jgi:glutamate formiminotransferase
VVNTDASFPQRGPVIPPSAERRCWWAWRQAAHAIGRRIGDEFAVPVMLYGSAHPHGRRLAQLRRDAGYFRGEKGGVWQGGVGQMTLAADFGPATACERRGMVCVGAGPWVVNYNVALRTTDLAGARLIARAVSTRGGTP